MNGAQSDPDITQVSILAGELRALVGKLKRRLREQANPGDLIPSQISVLLRLERSGPKTTSSLARAEGIRPQSMGITIAHLETVGWVHGRSDPNDARKTIMSLTNKGRDWISQGRAARQDWLVRTIGARLSRQEQTTLSKAVELLKRLTDD